MDSAALNGIAAVATTISSMFAAYATYQARRQVELADRSAEASAFLAINQEWNRVYPLYRRLLSKPFDCAATIKTNPDFTAYAATDEWHDMRAVFAFHEFLGACIRMKVLREPTLFSLVAVNRALWDKFYPLIAHYRLQGRPDLYTAWEYLMIRRDCYAAGEEHLPLPTIWERRRSRRRG